MHITQTPFITEEIPISRAQNKNLYTYNSKIHESLAYKIALCLIFFYFSSVVAENNGLLVSYLILGRP